MSILADWTILVKADGVKEAKKEVQSIKGGLDAGALAGKALNASLSFVAKLAAPVLIFAKAMSSALDSAQGQALSNVLERIFDILARLITPFIGLIASGLERWIPMLERVVGMIAPFVDLLVQVLDVVLLIGQQLFEFLVTPLMLVLELLGEITGVKPLQGPVKKQEKSKDGGFEDPLAVFKRIQERILKDDTGKQSLEALNGIRTLSAQVEANTRKMKPAVG